MKKYQFRWIFAFAISSILAVSAFVLSNDSQEKILHNLPYGFNKFSLSAPLPACARWKDNMPSSRDQQVYRLYIEARRLWRSKIEWELTREETTRILNDVRKAADLGDWGARALLGHFYLEGFGPIESNEVLKPDLYKAVEIARMAAKEMQPWGLYDLGVAYEHGYGGAHYDIELAWAYYFRAAQLGSPEAQMVLADAYGRAGRPKDEAIMLQCAYQQGHGPAAYELAVSAGANMNFQEAIRAYQDGVKFGSPECARDLKIMFNQGYWNKGSDAEKALLRSLEIKIDTERASRYNIIHDTLKINPDLKLTRLDQVLPLPPAELPPWDSIDDAIEPESYDKPTY